MLEVPAGQLDSLANDADVKSVAANAVVTSHMALATATTGAEAAWSGLVAALGAVNGSGVGVAIVDSGIAAHSSLASKVVVSVDFTRDRTAAAGSTATATARTWPASWPAPRSTAAAGNGAAGMAPGAHLINLRVLDDDGSGQVADVVEAHRLGDRQPRPLQHPRHQPVAGHAGDPVLP